MDLTFQPTKFLVLLAVTGIGLLLFRIPLKNDYERQFLYFGVLGFLSGRVLAALCRWLAGNTWLCFLFFF